MKNLVGLILLSTILSPMNFATAADTDNTVELGDTPKIYLDKLQKFGINAIPDYQAGELTQYPLAVFYIKQLIAFINNTIQHLPDMVPATTPPLTPTPAKKFFSTQILSAFGQTIKRSLTPPRRSTTPPSPTEGLEQAFAANFGQEFYDLLKAFLAERNTAIKPSTTAERVNNFIDKLFHNDFGLKRYVLLRETVGQGAIIGQIIGKFNAYLEGWLMAHPDLVENTSQTIADHLEVFYWSTLMCFFDLERKLITYAVKEHGYETLTGQALKLAAEAVTAYTREYYINRIMAPFRIMSRCSKEKLSPPVTRQWQKYGAHLQSHNQIGFASFFISVPLAQNIREWINNVSRQVIGFFASEERVDAFSDLTQLIQSLAENRENACQQCQPIISSIPPQPTEAYNFGANINPLDIITTESFRRVSPPIEATSTTNSTPSSDSPLGSDSSDGEFAFSSP